MNHVGLHQETPRTGERGVWRPRDTVWLAIALGCLFGLGEVTALGIRRFVLGRLTHMTPDVVWMAPLGYSALFVALSPLFLVIRRLGERSRGPYPTLLVCGALGLAGWIAMLPWALHGVAIAILAFALSDQLGRAASRRPEALRTAARGCAVGLVLVSVLGAATVTTHERRREARALAQLPDPAPDAPNVLLLVLDTVRARSLSLYGHRRPTTPFLDSLAHEATVFEWAIAPAPWTLPTHASMFTGLWPHETSVGWWAPLDDGPTTLAEELSRHGYVTAGFVANLIYASRVFGLDRGFAHYEDFPVTAGQVLLATALGRALATTDGLRRRLGSHEMPHRKKARRIREDFISWLDAQPRRPFFAFLNLFDSHEPYIPPPPYDGMFAPGYDRTTVAHIYTLDRGLLVSRPSPWSTPPPEIPLDLGTYEETIAYVDGELRRLFEQLDDRGELDRTLVVVASDHGEEFGERGTFMHGRSLYLPSVHVPLSLRLPGVVPEGLRVGTPVSLRDLPATVVDLIGLDEPGGFPGHSLRRTWDASRPGEVRDVVGSPALSRLRPGYVEQDWYPIARGSAMVSLVDAGYHYICNPDGTEELYDLTIDPVEREDLVEREPLEDLVAPFREIVRKIEGPPPECPPAPGTRPRPGRVGPPR